MNWNKTPLLVAVAACLAIAPTAGAAVQDEVLELLQGAGQSYSVACTLTNTAATATGVGRSTSASMAFATSQGSSDDGTTSQSYASGAGGGTASAQTRDLPRISCDTTIFGKYLDTTTTDSGVSCAGTGALGVEGDLVRAEGSLWIVDGTVAFPALGLTDGTPGTAAPTVFEDTGLDALVVFSDGGCGVALN